MNFILNKNEVVTVTDTAIIHEKTKSSGGTLRRKKSVENLAPEVSTYEYANIKSFSQAQMLSNKLAFFYDFGDKESQVVIKTKQCKVIYEEAWKRILAMADAKLKKAKEEKKKKKHAGNYVAPKDDAGDGVGDLPNVGSTTDDVFDSKARFGANEFTPSEVRKYNRRSMGAAGVASLPRAHSEKPGGPQVVGRSRPKPPAPVDPGDDPFRAIRMDMGAPELEKDINNDSGAAAGGELGDTVELGDLDIDEAKAYATLRGNRRRNSAQLKLGKAIDERNKGGDDPEADAKNDADEMDDLDKMLANDLAGLQDAEVTLNLLDSEMQKVGMETKSTKELTTQQLLDMLQNQNL